MEIVKPVLLFIHILDSSINFWKQRKKRSAKETNQDCGLDHTIQQKMEILQNGVIVEDEENKQSYRGGAFDERLFISHCYVKFNLSLLKILVKFEVIYGVFHQQTSYSYLWILTLKISGIYLNHDPNELPIKLKQLMERRFIKSGQQNFITLF